MWQWFSATVAVLALILLAARGLRAFLDRVHKGQGVVTQVGAWRVSPDASVRAVRTFGRVHLLYERGRESLVLESLTDADFERRSGHARPKGAEAVALQTETPPGRRMARA